MKPLTKSRFKTALECPNKLFFTSKKEYANNKSEDPFLQALASGGFQVEELARLIIQMEFLSIPKTTNTTKQYNLQMKLYCKIMPLSMKQHFILMAFL